MGMKNNIKKKNELMLDEVDQNNFDLQIHY